MDRIFSSFPPSGRFADKILKGARPGSADRTADAFQAGVNLKTAKALGLSVPPSLLATADKCRMMRREFRY